MKKTIVVAGAGKGLGNAVARKFGKNDFRVALMARNAESLAEYAKEFEEAGIEIVTQTVDVADDANLAEALEKVKEQYGVPDVLFYNVGVTAPDEKGAVTSKTLMERYQVDVAGAYNAIQQVVCDEFSKKNGTILVTGGGLAMYPTAAFLPLSMDKAALRAMVQALNAEYKEKNIYVGTVTICDAIGGTEKYMPEQIAEKFWELYNNRADAEIIY